MIPLAGCRFEAFPIDDGDMPGQFFVTHQGSEKGDDMIGTLVVILPSAFKGGAVVIEHHGEQVAFRAAAAR